MADCMWREIMLAWVSFAGVTFFPVAINEIGDRIVADRDKVEVRSITDGERCIARWRALPVTFHFDQLNMCDFAQRLGKGVQRACLQLGGLLSFEEAKVVTKLIQYTASQSSSVLLAHDLEP